MKPIIYFILSFFFVSFASGQTIVSTTLYGKIVADYPDLDGITVYNLKSELIVISEKNGYFTIAASVGDTIQFSAVQFQTYKHVVKSKNLNDSNVIIQMQLATNELKEVIVNEYGHINEVSLGIVPANQKKYTVAERRLKAAGDFRPTSLLGIIAGGMDVDALVNAISGRTKRLKKELENERKSMAIAKISNLFPATYFTKVLKIPDDNVEGFKYFAVENAKFMESISTVEKPMLSFLLIEIAEEYNSIISTK